MALCLVSFGMRQLGKITCYIPVPKGVCTEDAARLFLEGHREKTSKKIISCLANTTTFHIILHYIELTFLKIKKMFIFIFCRVAFLLLFN